MQLLFRQGMPGAHQAQHAVVDQAEDDLGPLGWLGEHSPAAVFADTTMHPAAPLAQHLVRLQTAAHQGPIPPRSSPSPLT
ncbi:hypothetical protein ACFYR1_05095 [Streptomyces canus]|uniref:hypothetical protein n=1 Tax=Streptomyces canus TaxID=58343 RepID=UPI0036C1EE5B